jgi:hypothetical protein
MMIIDPKDKDHYKHLATGEYWGEEVTFALTDEEYRAVFPENSLSIES